MGRRGLIIALFVSLVVNVFVIGGIVGAGLSGVRLRPPPHAGGGGPPRGPMAQAIRTLSPEQQQAWRESMRAQGRNPGQREARRIHRAAMLRFGEEPFPRDAILAEFNRARALEQQGRSAVDQRIVDFAASLPRDDRARFGEALARPNLGRGGPGRGGFDRRGALQDR